MSKAKYQRYYQRAGVTVVIGRAWDGRKCFVLWDRGHEVMADEKLEKLLPRYEEICDYLDAMPDIMPTGIPFPPGIREEAE